ncbi:hypothetical protein [Streptomyces sulfonofaciens]|uniref:hypothetical protein n=1 Tax=Streptomyces sulfonofaciens TaxID=68272 RepID=UPI001671FDCB|nr:hypothetical protein [Streptomyces sulfonofaciens]
MKPQVNIAVVVDVIGALSDRSLLGGNCCLIDDGPFDSTGQGTHELHTAVAPGQVVQWYALAVDLQTPVEIRNITFLGGADAAGGAGPGERVVDGDHLDLNVWSGVVPYSMTRGVPHRYRLELQMYEGENSVLHLETPGLLCV